MRFIKGVIFATGTTIGVTKLWTTGKIGLLTVDYTGVTIEGKWAVGVGTTGLTGNVDIVGGLTTDTTTLLTGATNLIGTGAIGWVLTTIGIALREIMLYIILGCIVELSEY